MNQEQYKPASLDKVASFMAGLSVAAKQMKLAEFALMELLAWCAFSDNREKPLVLS